MPVEGADADPGVAAHDAAQVGDGQAALVVLEGFVPDGLDHRIDQDGQGDRWLVRVARVVRHLDHGDPHGFVDLGGGQTRPVGVAHGLDQVVDERLDPVRADLLGRHRLGGGAQDRVPDARDLAKRHGQPLTTLALSAAFPSLM